MAFPVDAGINSLSGKQIATIYSSKILERFYERTVLAAISNTQYEGEIKDKGDKVVITKEPLITINDYVVGSGLTRQRVEPETVDLMIDKGKYYSFTVNDVEQAQAHINLNFTDSAGSQLKVVTDTLILNDIPADADSANIGTTAGAISGDINLGTTAADGSSAIGITSDNIIEYITLCELALDEQNVPENDRWMVIPSWMKQKALLSELKDASLSGDEESMLINGRLGRIGNFTIYASNCISAVTEGSVKCYNALFGHKSALTFASQLVKNRMINNPDDFGDIVEGLHVFGYEVIKRESLGVLYAKKG